MGEMSRSRPALSRGIAQTAFLLVLQLRGEQSADATSPIPPPALPGSPLRRHLRSVPDRTAPSPAMVMVSNALRAPDPVLLAEGSSSDPCVSRMQYVVTECDFHNRQTVRWLYGEGDASSNCEASLPDSEQIKCDHVSWRSGEAVAVGVLAGFGIGISLFFAMALIRYRICRAIRLDHPRLCLAFVAGVSIMCLSALMLLGQNTDVSCALRLWTCSVGFDLAFGALALKLWRALSVLESSKQFGRASVSARKVQGMLVIVLLGDAGFLIAWTASVGGRQSEQKEISVAGDAIERVSCVTFSTEHYFAWVAFKVMLVGLCCYLSFRTRKMQPQGSESGGVALAAYNLAMAALIVAAVLWADANPQVTATTEATSIILAGVGALCTILSPKILCAKQELEGKALVGPSAVVSSNSGDAMGTGDTTSGGSLVSAGTGGQQQSGVRGARALLTRACSGGSQQASGDVFRKATDGDKAYFDGQAAGGAGADPEGSTPLDFSDTENKLDSPSLMPAPSATVADSRPAPASAVIGPPPGGTNGSRLAAVGGNFATTGGGGGNRGLIVPDPSGFLTPPRRVRRSRSSAETSTRAADGMALAAAAAAAGIMKESRHSAQIGGARGRRVSSSTTSLSGGQRDGRSARGEGAGGNRVSGHGAAAAGGGNNAGAKPPLSGSGSSRNSKASRASRASSRGRHSTRSKKVSASAGRISSGDSSSMLSGASSWINDPLMLAMNGYGWAGHGGTGAHSGAWPGADGAGSSKGGDSRRKSGGRRSGKWSTTSSLKRGMSRERSSSMGSTGARRSSAAGSLVMKVETGTTLHCPHCDREVAGCGFKGCAGSLIRAPSFSDDDGGRDFMRAPIPPPLLPPLVPTAGLSALAGGRFSADGRLPWTGRGSGASAGAASSVSQSAAASTAAAPVALSPTHSSHSRANRLRMSFLRGRPPCDTFDNDTDSSLDLGERSSLGIASPTSSSTWA